jgi:serine/threonine protein kinase
MNDSPETGHLLAKLFPELEVMQRITAGAYGEIWMARNECAEFKAIKWVSIDSNRGQERHKRERRGIRLIETLPSQPVGLVPVEIVRDLNGIGFAYVMPLADAERPNWLTQPEEYRPRTLRSEILARRAISLNECLQIAERLASALNFLQSNRFVHRDIKPSNVIALNGEWVLADVGLLADVRDANSCVGTPGYIPTEQHGTFEADIYSLGVLLYEISCGRPPNELGFCPVEEAECNAPLFADWLRIVQRACDPDPRKRYQTAKALLHDLATLATATGKRRRLVPIILTGMMSVTLAAMVINYFPTSTSQKQSKPSRLDRIPFDESRQIMHRSEVLLPEESSSSGIFVELYEDHILVGAEDVEAALKWRLVFYWRPPGPPDRSPLVMSEPPQVYESRPARRSGMIGPGEPDRPPPVIKFHLPENIMGAPSPENYPSWIYLVTQNTEELRDWIESRKNETDRSRWLQLFRQWNQLYRATHQQAGPSFRAGR